MYFANKSKDDVTSRIPASSSKVEFEYAKKGSNNTVGIYGGCKTFYSSPFSAPQKARLFALSLVYIHV